MVVQISLEGKVAVVTGASRGIGEATARTFVARGARVMIASRKLEGVDAVASSIAKEYGADRIRAVAAHTGKEDDCARLVRETIAAFGRVDVLVNNAGTNPYFGPMVNAEGPAWDKTFDVNLKGYFWCAREVARQHVADHSEPCIAWRGWTSNRRPSWSEQIFARTAVTSARSISDLPPFLAKA